MPLNNLSSNILKTGLNVTAFNLLPVKILSMIAFCKPNQLHRLRLWPHGANKLPIPQTPYLLPFLLIFVCATFLPCFLPANEFWLQPEKFFYKRGETINIRFKLGQQFQGHNWYGNASRINSLRFYMASIKDDLSANMSLDSGDSLQIAMFDEGTAMVTFQSTNAFVKMKARYFNEYLAKNALADAIAFRKNNDDMDAAGKEFYQRNVKTLFQVGPTLNNCYRLTTSLPLDIIPQSNPYGMRNNQVLEVRVLFNKKPFKNKCVRLWHRVNNKTVLKDVRTDANGNLSFRMQKTGRWMISTVAMTHLKKGDADWQSYWGSLTWGYGS